MKTRIRMFLLITMSFILCACGNKEQEVSTEETVEIEITSIEVQTEESTEIVNENETYDYWYHPFMMSGQEFLDFCNELFPGGTYMPASQNRWSSKPYYAYSGDYASVDIYIPTTSGEYSAVVAEINKYDEFKYCFREGYESVDTYQGDLDYQDVPVSQDYFEMHDKTDGSLYGYVLLRGNIVVVVTFQNQDVPSGAIMTYVLEKFSEFNSNVNYYEISKMCNQKATEETGNTGSNLEQESVDVFEQYVIDNADNCTITSDVEEEISESVTEQIPNETSKDSSNQENNESTQDYSNYGTKLTPEEYEEMYRIIERIQNPNVQP